MRLYANLGEPRGQLAAIATRLSDREVTLVPLVPQPSGRATVAAVVEAPDAEVDGRLALWRDGAFETDLAAILAALGVSPDDRFHAVERDLLRPIEQLADPADAEAYARGFGAVFAQLDRLEGELAQQRFVGGSEPTLADWLLWCVLLRFDVVYYPLYKLNRTRVGDMTELAGYLRDLWQRGVATDTVDLTAIKQAHFWVEAPINHRRLIPRGGEPDLVSPHDRDRFDSDGGRATEEVPGAPQLPGAFVRKRSAHRDWITADGSSGFAAEPGRYHIYIANNCPWCHRVALARSVRGLEEAITMDVLFYRRDPDRGWQFQPDEPGCTTDRLFSHRYVVELYERLGSKEKSVPVLYDRETDRIVSNESAEIIRMLDQAFKAIATGPELYPEDLREEIDGLNRWTYTDINNGAYKAGFAHGQAAYDAAFERFFAAIDRLDRRLATRRFLCGDRLTEADLRLFPTIFRFDHVYYTRFRLNRRMIRDCEHLHRWLRDMVAIPEVMAASNLDHCKKGYFGRTGNGIVPVGPAFGFEPRG